MLLELGLIFLGILGLLMRRNLIAIGFCFQLVFLGALLWFIRAGAEQEAILLSFVFSLYTLLYTVVVIFVWRQHGSLHIDEIRELQG